MWESKVTDENREKVDGMMHKYVGEQSRFGRCFADWRKVRKDIQTNDEILKSSPRTFTL